MKRQHVKLEQFLHAFASRGFVSVSWACLFYFVGGTLRAAVVLTAGRMAGKCQTSAAHQTMKFVYSEAVNRALRQRCRGLAVASVDDSPPLPSELLLAALQSGDLDLSVVSGKSAGRHTADAAEATLTDNFDFEISNLSEIYGEISRVVEQVRQRSTTNDAPVTTNSSQHDRPATRASAAASKTPAKTGDKSVNLSLQSSCRNTGKDSDKRQKDARKVHFNTSNKQEPNGD